MFCQVAGIVPSATRARITGMSGSNDAVGGLDKALGGGAQPHPVPAVPIKRGLHGAPQALGETRRAHRIGVRGQDHEFGEILPSGRVRGARDTVERTPQLLAEIGKFRGGDATVGDERGTAEQALVSRRGGRDLVGSALQPARIVNRPVRGVHQAVTPGLVHVELGAEAALQVEQEFLGVERAAAQLGWRRRGNASRRICRGRGGCRGSA